MKLKFLVLIIAALVLGSCLAKEDDSTSASFLVINSLTGKDLEGNEGSTTVFSDVSLAGSIVNDNGVASVIALTYNPTEDSDEHDITYYMNVVVDQIDVEFMRPDGRNVEGVDVPYRFSQPMTMIVPIDEEVEIPFILIRHVAKLEMPLLGLREVPNREIDLQLVAKVTLHGKDLGGHRVAPVSQNVDVWCCNYADEEPEPVPPTT